MQPKKIVKKISFIGSGNVAWGLAPFFKDVGVEIVEVYSTNQATSAEFAREFKSNVAKSLSSLNKNSELYIVAVPDKEIEKLALVFPEVNGIVAHTSGIVSMNVLKKCRNYGVFYPLQTFTRGLVVDISKVPICIEASNDEVKEELAVLASKLSNNINFIHSEERKKLHLSAVLVSNFTNLLYNYADELLAKSGMDLQMLIPLIEESVRKIQFLKPQEAQTGPARRNDQNTIEAHLKMLEGFPDIQNLYSLLSEQIRMRYHE
jgi:predicted short-subunit dehydrogenase-like oxidoreductase (DUF2520 family)